MNDPAIGENDAEVIPGHRSRVERSENEQETALRAAVRVSLANAWPTVEELRTDGFTRWFQLPEDATYIAAAFPAVVRDLLAERDALRMALMRLLAAADHSHGVGRITAALDAESGNAREVLRARAHDAPSAAGGPTE
jgi:hypothetical protein